MRISSYRKRSLAERDNLSFNSIFYFSGIEGLSQFGFSGDSSVLEFAFSGGRIIDPEGNYTYDYLPDTEFTISGNINQDIYNYYVNSEYIAQYPKSFERYNYVYFNSNISFDVDLTVMASGQDVTYSYPSSFDTGNPFSFALTNVHTGYPFRIFSGSLLLDGAQTSIFDFQTGSFPQTVGTGTNIIIRDLGGERGATYPFDFTLYTNQGNLTGNFSVIDNIPTYNVTFDFINLNNSGYANYFYDSGYAEDLTYTTQNNYRYGNFRVDYEIDTPSTGKSFLIKLIDSGNNTGNYLAPFVTGITITNSGEGYVSAPSVVFNGGGGAGAAATVSLAGGYLNTITFSSFGTGYTSAPEISFDGGNPTYSGSGVAILSGYTKTFFNTWQLYTGDNISTLASFSTQTGVSSYISTVPVPYSVNNLFVTVSNRNWWDEDLTYAELTVSGLDNNIETLLISGGYRV